MTYKIFIGTQIPEISDLFADLPQTIQTALLKESLVFAALSEGYADWGTVWALEQHRDARDPQKTGDLTVLNRFITDLSDELKLGIPVSR